MSKKSDHDRIFADPQTISDFDFGDRTALVFDDMLSRSVPFYAEVQRMVGELAATYHVPGTPVLDLGCSTGTTLGLLGRALPDTAVPLIGVDNSPSMLERARHKLGVTGLLERCELIEADICEFTPPQTGLVTLILTLQFIRPARRAALFQRIADSLHPGGALILVEKVLCADTDLDRNYIAFYYDFKQRQGYSELEIAQKREALENVLIPYRIDENVQLLRDSGFHVVESFFRWYNFAGIFARKAED
ncbi:MAG: carboxy-S-adenosyl-L-methionine synthase CmoA [Gammaproteobacteria bacterium]|nr:carboxy-S-adenosyl-L-methionine synthase CmoA [Gammaproteobacteria bacterium]